MSERYRCSNQSQLSDWQTHRQTDRWTASPHRLWIRWSLPVSELLLLLPAGPDTADCCWSPSTQDSLTQRSYPVNTPAYMNTLHRSHISSHLTSLWRHRPAAAGTGSGPGRAVSESRTLLFSNTHCHVAETERLIQVRAAVHETKKVLWNEHLSTKLHWLFSQF